MNPFKLIGAFFQARREERIKAAHAWNKRQEQRDYLRRKGYILPQARPDHRDVLDMHKRIVTP